MLWRPSFQTISADVLRDLISDTKEVPQLSTLIHPLYGAVSTADGSFTMYTEGTDRLLELAEEEIRQFLSMGSSDTQTITKSQYDQAMGEWESVQLEMGFGLPLSEFCSYFCGSSLDNGASDIRFDVLAFSKASAESFFAVDRSADRYYRIVFGQQRDAAGLLIAAAEGTGQTCYRAQDILGCGDALIGIAPESTLTLQEVVFEGQGHTAARGVQIAESIFGDTFDFVRRITDTFGNTTYMYGSGEKTFYSSVSGRYEYRTEPSDKEAAGLFDDLQTAVESLVYWGGLSTGDLTLVLEDYSESGSGRNRQRTFCFTQLLDGVRVFSDEIYCARVTVSGGTVSYMSRKTAAVKDAVYREDEETAQPANVIANNSNHIYNILSNNTLAAASDEAFSRASLESVSLVPGYYASERNGVLIPCWILRTKNGTRFYFELYTATPMGFARKGD